MIFSGRVEMVGSGPDTIAVCGAGDICRKVLSSTGGEARLGVAVSSFRKRGQSAEGVVTEDNLHRCTSSILPSRDDYCLCREEDFNC